jgi:hypothetical protein
LRVTARVAHRAEGRRSRRFLLGTADAKLPPEGLALKRRVRKAVSGGSKAASAETLAAQRARIAAITAAALLAPS